jgi:pimeloyl-ACP methyl ester carboxylesterase
MTAVQILILVVLFLGAVYVAICYIFAQMTLNPSRQPVAVSPADYGLEYEEVEFESLEGLRLKGWFVPGDPRKVLVLTHPMFCNRHGLLVRNKSPLMAVKTDVDLMLSVQALNQAGYSVLAFDFRNHGASEDGMTGVGLDECQDVLGALDYLEGRPELEGAAIGLVAFCMGANATIIAMSREPEAFARARCLVAIQPISMSVFVRSYLRSTYTPLGLAVLPLTEALRRWLGGHPLEAMSPREYVKDIKVPTLYVQGRTDPWTELSDIEGMYEATQAPKEFWWLETTKSRPEAYQHVGEHPGRMVEFIDTHMA